MVLYVECKVSEVLAASVLPIRLCMKSEEYGVENSFVSALCWRIMRYDVYGEKENVMLDAPKQSDRRQVRFYCKKTGLDMQGAVCIICCILKWLDELT